MNYFVSNNDHQIFGRLGANRDQQVDSYGSMKRHDQTVESPFQRMQAQQNHVRELGGLGHGLAGYPGIAHELIPYLLVR